MTSVILFKTNLWFLKDINAALEAYSYVAKTVNDFYVPLQPSLLLCIIRIMGKSMSEDILQKWLKKVYQKLEWANPDYEDPTSVFKDQPDQKSNADKKFNKRGRHANNTNDEHTRPYGSTGSANIGTKVSNIQTGSKLDTRSRQKLVKTLGDNSFKSEILATMSKADTKLKLLPHEFLFLIVNASDRLNILSDLPRWVIKNTKQKTEIGLDIYLLTNDHNVNKSPYRRMKRVLDCKVCSYILAFLKWYMVYIGRRQECKRYCHSYNSKTY